VDERAEAETREFPLGAQLLALLLAAAGLYANSLAVPFLFDDPVPSAPLDYATRPLVWASFDLNRAWSGAAVWSYHVVNIAVHAAAAVALLCVLRRALALAWPAATAADRAALAFATALAWTCHPLGTSAVTYLSQRAESLAALFALLTCLGFLLVVARERVLLGWSLCVLGTVAGFATKETAATVPLILLFFERTLVRDDLAATWRARGRLHLVLALLSALLAWFFIGPLLFAEQSSAGFGAHEFFGPREYLRSQYGVLLHYLRLVFWPHPLVFDYGWPVAHGFAAIVPPFLAVLALLGATLALLRRRHPLGAAAGAFFLYLAPTSSIVPVKDIAFEHRMYLPLAAVLVAAFALAARLMPVAVRARGLAAAGFVLAVPLGALTVLRNREYRSAEAIWTTVVERAPENPRGYNNLAAIRLDQERYDEAETLLARALELKPRYARAEDNLGVLAAARGRIELALEHFARANAIEESARVHTHMARLLELTSRGDEAEQHHRRALELAPRDGRVHLALGQFLARAGRMSEARASFERAVTLDRYGAEARRELERLPPP
jgi:Tfp pilus assembly protein PilF